MPPQSSRDRILWILTNSGGSMVLGKLRGETGMRYAILTPAILLLHKEGRIELQQALIPIPRQYSILDHAERSKAVRRNAALTWKGERRRRRRPSLYW